MSVRYCGRDFSDEELHHIRQLIAENPTCHRAQLSRMTCEILRWYKADRGLKEMSARVAMLRMQDDGLITLPPPRRTRPDPTVHLTDRTAPGTQAARHAARSAQVGITPLGRYVLLQYRHSPHPYGLTSISNATTALTTSPCLGLSAT